MLNIEKLLYMYINKNKLICVEKLFFVQFDSKFTSLFVCIQSSKKFVVILNHLNVSNCIIYCKNIIFLGHFDGD